MPKVQMLDAQLQCLRDAQPRAITQTTQQPMLALQTSEHCGDFGGRQEHRQMP
jgi:hypothetical protein